MQIDNVIDANEKHTYNNEKGIRTNDILRNLRIYTNHPIQACSPDLVILKAWLSVR